MMGKEPEIIHLIFQAIIPGGLWVNTSKLGTTLSRNAVGTGNSNYLCSFYIS